MIILKWLDGNVYESAMSISRVMAHFPLVQRDSPREFVDCAREVPAQHRVESESSRGTARNAAGGIRHRIRGQADSNR